MRLNPDSTLGALHRLAPPLLIFTWALVIVSASEIGIVSLNQRDVHHLGVSSKNQHEATYG